MVKKARDIMTKDFLELRTTDTLSYALGKLKKNKQNYTLVFTTTGSLAGVVSRKDLLKSRVDPHTTKLTGVRRLLKGAPKCKAGDDLFRIVEIMIGAYPTCVAVMKGNSVKGVVYAKDLLKELTMFKTLADMRVSEIMTSNPVTAHYNTRVGDALNFMKEKNIGHIPVVDSVDGHVISVLSYSDLAEHVLIYPRHKQKGIGRYGERGASGKGWSPRNKILLDAPIGDIASVTIITAKPDDSLRTIVSKLNKYDISDLVIVEDNKPVGMVTTRDLLEVFIRIKEPELWNIHYIGIDGLKPFQAKAVREVVNEKFEKISRTFFKLEDIVYLAVHIKFYEEGVAGKIPQRGRTKYVVRLRLSMPSFVVVVDDAHFDLMTAVQWALDELDRKVRDKVLRMHKRETNIGKGRRAIYQHYIRKTAARLDLRPAFSKLIKR
jgi:CBS domain-containing protein